MAVPITAQETAIPAIIIPVLNHWVEVLPSLWSKHTKAEELLMTGA